MTDTRRIVPSQRTAGAVDAADLDVVLWRRIVDTVRANAEYPFPPEIDPKRFAEIIGVGRRPPTSLDLAMIADYYRVSVAWLVTGSNRGLDDGVVTELQDHMRYLRNRAEAAETELARLVWARHGIWQIVGELRDAAEADGRGRHGDPLAQRLAEVLSAAEEIDPPTTDVTTTDTTQEKA